MPRVKKFGGTPKFRGNRYTVNSSDSVINIVGNSVESHVNSESRLGIGKKVSSKKKLLVSVEDEDVNTSFIGPQVVSGNCILDLELLSSALCTAAVCSKCREGKLTLFETGPRKGLSTKFEMVCDVCDFKTEFSNSKKLKSDHHEVNVRYMYGLRCIGKGYAGGEMLCAILDLPPPASKFSRLTTTVLDAVENVAEESMKKAALEAVEENGGNDEICAAFDGTWQKRGHTSLNGVMVATSIDSGKVLDVACMSKYCAICKGDENINHICQANYEGVSGGMESAGALKIFKRSEANRGVQYVEYLGDGDSKAFKKVAEAKPYGDKTITKLECIGHVKKRMTARLKKACQDKTKLSDGKPLGGRSRLTDGIIQQLQSFYRNAIVNNQDCETKMARAVWATWFHYYSTDSHPSHQLCPIGETSWCKYNKAIARGEQYSHKAKIPQACLLAIKPIYKDLAHPDLLKKCKHGKTQNPNESFNSIVWSRIPKTVFVGPDTLKLGVLDAVISFNEGELGKIKVLEQLGMSVGRNTKFILKRIDTLRVKKREKELNNLLNVTTMENPTVKRKLNMQDDPDDPEYGAGMH